MFYEADRGHGLPHDPLKAIVAPRPIGWISSRSAEGDLNLAPYSFFNALSSKPMLVWFSSEGEKDSVTFIRETGEFVANLVTLDLADKMNATSVDAPRGTSEFGYAGLTPAPSRLVAAPRVAEAHAALECRVTEIHQPKLLDGSKAGVTVVTGQVIGVHIDDACLTDGLFDSAKAQNLARLGYMDYAAVQEVFRMRRPRWEK
ncbi:flavin reductase family protein [Aquibium sp. ELW1220]|uniref:flavin reductase family protein n=1 Tax=Aquibium sp. ELW1220 TaxID=2976766 RepID=UPI0025B1DC1C|nr:flavin reductase family protein [Aquibium sp. ELW1220]MDN2579161.1 flavin reductase family protein [Aquibium sp. ELW1220]